MTRKDYILLAKIIRSGMYELATSGDDAEREFGLNVLCRHAHDMADAVKTDNPNFNHAAFLQACGITQSENHA